MISQEPIHIRLELSCQEALLRQSLYTSLLKATPDAFPEVQRPLRILDAGAGRAELMALFHAQGHEAHGIDMEAACIQVASRYGKCKQGGISEIARLFDGQPGARMILQTGMTKAKTALQHRELPVGCVRLLSFLWAAFAFSWSWVSDSTFARRPAMTLNMSKP